MIIIIFYKIYIFIINFMVKNLMFQFYLCTIHVSNLLNRNFRELINNKKTLINGITYLNSVCKIYGVSVIYVIDFIYYFYQFRDITKNNLIKISNTLTHEIGHALGMDHINENNKTCLCFQNIKNCIMYPLSSSREMYNSKLIYLH